MPFRTLLALVATVFSASAALAQYPTKPVRVVVTFPPGGTPDTPEEFASKIKRDIGRWEKIVKAAGVKPE